MYTEAGIIFLNCKLFLFHTNSGVDNVIRRTEKGREVLLTKQVVLIPT